MVMNENSNQFKNKKWVDSKMADSGGEKVVSDQEQVVIYFGGSRLRDSIAMGKFGY